MAPARIPLFRRRKSASCSPPMRKLSMICRGKPINRDDLFRYTNGRFLVDERRQLEIRYLNFNLDALCEAVVRTEQSPIQGVEKMEGGFSKAFLMKRQNGTEVVAKLPCRNAGPITFTTASEVAVLEYVMQRTNIPVPKVYSWSSSISNPVGAEYIIMEKAVGVPLFEKWEDMTDVQKLEFIKQLTKLEHDLSSIHFPAYGNLYFRPPTTRSFRYQVLDNTIDPADSYCVGPLCTHTFVPDSSTNETDWIYENGPWKSLSAFGIAIAKRELRRITNPIQQQSGTFYHGTCEEQQDILEDTIRLMKLLDSNSVITQHSQPLLWHTDLHMGNIFVSADDPSQIVSIIDWQSTSILPAFLQAQWPAFLKPPSEYVRGLFHPKLPDNIDDLDPDEKALAIRDWEQAKLAKAYEVSSYLENRTAHNAMIMPRVFRELFIRCGEVSEFGVIPLRSCLLEIFQNWSSLGFTGDCPYSFTQADIQRHESQFEEYENWHKIQQLARDCLETDAEGWISPELDFDKKRKQNKELFEMFVKQMAGEKSVEEAKAMWPFPEGL